MSRIVRLEAENVKRLRVVAIEPTGPLTIIGGRNAQGKSSTLDALSYALGGERLCPEEPIRRGAYQARVTVTLDDGLEVVRTWTRRNDGSIAGRLEVRSADGAKYSAPQAMLDKLVGKLAFDPVAFLRLRPDQQAEEVRKVAGLDFSELDSRRKRAYDGRTEVNRDVKSLEAQALAIPEVEAPDEEVSLEDLTREGQRLMVMEMARREGEDLVRRLENRVRSWTSEGTEIERQIAALEHKLAEVYRKQEAEEAGLEAAKDRIASIPEVSPADRDAVLARVGEAESVNRRVRQKKTRQELCDKLEEARIEALGLSEEIAAIDAEKARLLGEAKLPVPGLGFDDQGVTLGGLPLDQASQAERMRLALGLGLARSADLKVVLIRDGSLLDDESLAAVEAMAEAAGAQVLLESVGEGRAHIVIEDGCVKSDS